MSESRASILIAQSDSADELLSSVLIEEGYRVEQTRDARLLLTETNRLTPALIVLDSAVTGGDAFTLCARLRETSAVPILMLLPPNDELIERAYKMGASDVLLKPIQKTLLTRRIRTLIDAQHQTEQAQTYEKRWQQAFERNRAVQLIVNPKNGHIVDANPSACVFYGYPREEFRHKLITDLDVPNTSADGEMTLFNFRHRTASGQIRDVKVFSSPLEYDGQTLLYMIIYDISKQRTQVDQNVLAEALRNTAAALSSTLDQNEVLDRILEQVNLVVPSECANIMLIEAGVASVARSRGYEAHGQENRPSIEAIHLTVRDTPTLHWMVENNRALAIPNIDTYPGWIAVKNIDNWLKSYVAAPIRIGNYVIGFLNIDSGKANAFGEEDADHLQIFADQAAIAIRNARLFDRVRRQAAEMERRVLQRTAELEYERGQMSAILDAMTEGVAYTETIGGQLQVRYVNQALVQIMGYSPEEWNTYSLTLLRSKGESDEAFNVLMQTSTQNLLSKGYWHNETRLIRKDGSEFDAVTISTAVVMPGSNTTGAVTVIRDVSKEKALQQQKERFVAYASHELRTPITNLKTRLYLMRRQPERMEEHMRVLEHVTDRMKRLVEDLLDVSRFERGVIKLNFEDVLLQDAIRTLVEIQQPEAERKQLQLICTLADEALHVHADSERLAQVITNLLTNAINYTSSGGTIEVRLSKICDVTGALAQIEVEDSGIGIAEEHLPHIFQPFYRVISQVEGTGLGLSITKEIVELHGGDIEVSSQIGVGSIFRFWLPVIENTQENHPHTPIELAEAFIQTGELSDALDALNQHLEAHSDDQAVRRLRASVLLHLPGHEREALLDLDALAAPTADDLLLRAQTLEALGDQAGAFAALEQAWTAYHDPRSAELLLSALYKRGEAARALDLLADLPKSWKWLGWSGDFYALKGEFAIAAEHFCSALDLLDQGEKNGLTETQRAHLLLRRADAYRRLKRYADADADYRAAEAIIPSDPMIPFNRGLLTFEQGKLRAALPLCRDALDHAPEGLREHMRRVLTSDPRYNTLVQALLP